MTEDEMDDDEDPKALRVVADLCDEAQRLYGQFCHRVNWNPSSGSPMDSAMRSALLEKGPEAWPDGLIGDTSDAAQWYLFAATRYLAGIPHLLRSDAWSFGVPPLARSVTESCSRSMWLLDSAIQTRPRAARMLLDALGDARRSRKLAKDAKHPQAPERKQLVRQIESLIPRFFLPSEVGRVEEDGQEKLVLCGEVLPGPTKMIQIAGATSGNPKLGVSQYAALCAATHPSMFVINGHTGVATVEGGYRQRQYQPSVAFAISSALAGLWWFHRGWRLANYWLRGGETQENDEFSAAYNAVEAVMFVQPARCE